MNAGQDIFSIPKYSDCYGALAKERMIFLSEDLTKESAAALSAMLLYYDATDNHNDISIYINTNGGDVSALTNIYDVMQMISSPIKTICIGKAYSAGSFLLAAGTKGKRFITKNATVMIHGIQAAFPESPFSDQKDAEIYFNLLKDYNNLILSLLAKHTGQTIEKILEDCKRDRFLDAEEAIEYGIVDKII